MESTTTAFGMAHRVTQNDAVAKALLAVPLLMSISSWALIAVKGAAHWRRLRRGDALLGLYWNARSVDETLHKVASPVGEALVMTGLGLAVACRAVAETLADASKAGLHKRGFVSEPKAH